MNVEGLENIYLHLPVWAQHVAITLQGLRLRKRRYTKSTWQMFQFLMQSQFWTKEQFEEYQLAKLRQLVERALSFSPYFREWYGSLGVNQNVLRNLSDIRKLPILTEEQFRQHSDRIVCTDINLKRVYFAFTSSTTRPPLKIYFTIQSVNERIAFWERLCDWFNLRRWRKCAKFTSRPIVPLHARSGPFYRINIAANQQLYSIYHLKPAFLNSYVEQLAQFQPELIEGYPSAIHLVAEHILRNGLTGKVNPRVIFTTSEPLFSFIRKRISSAFRCQVVNIYGSEEGIPIAYECPEGGFHTCPESGIFEILRFDGTPCEPGEIGRLVLTSFTSEAMPLIRYEIGDLAAWKPGVCGCGRRMPMLTTIYGRLNNIFYTKEKGFIYQIDSALLNLPSSIIEIQVAQVGDNDFEVRIVVDSLEFNNSDEDILKANLRSHLGNDVNIKIKCVSRISRAKSGKLQIAVNEYHNKNFPR